MAEHWRIPAPSSFQRSGTEWLAQTLCDLPETERMELMMTLWRCWHVRNEVTHHKPAPPVEASKRFLLSYVDTLIGLQNATTGSLVKGKQVVDVVQHRASILHVPKQPQPHAIWKPPPDG